MTVSADIDGALAAMISQKYDLIISDILLGAKSGIDLLRALKEIDPLCPLVFITGAPNINSSTEAVRLGAFDYIPKPVRQATLLRVAKRAVLHGKLLKQTDSHQKHLEAIFRCVVDAVISVDHDCAVRMANNAASSICFLPEESPSNGSATFPDECKMCLEALRASMSSGANIIKERMECHRGQIVTLTASPITDHAGHISGALLVVHDETRLVNLERQIDSREYKHNIVGTSAPMQRVSLLIRSLCNVDSTILLLGESGTGKELVADALHYGGERSAYPLVKVNCSALTEELLESELFGHVQGAFTGAIRDKIGRFQRADGGTIFLDEIGDISPRIQVKLLRVLQNHEFERVGEATPIKVNVRVVTATNRNLRELVSNRAFREDLYYRLKVIEITVPPLRERRTDIPLLVRHFIVRLSERLRKQISHVSEDVLHIFMEHNWPGNVRELEHALEHGCLMAAGKIITVQDLPDDLRPSVSPLIWSGGIIDRQTLFAALQNAGWNKTETGKLLNISRRTVYRKMAELNIQQAAGNN